MAKNESPKDIKKEIKESNETPKIPGLSAKAFGVIKFTLGIMLLPFVYSASVSFFKEFAVVDAVQQENFWAGVITFLVVYLFVWKPAFIYNKGQQVLEVLFSFFKPLVKVAPYLVPIFAILLFLAYKITVFVAGPSRWLTYFVFFFGFSVAMHLVFSAESLRSKQGDFLKANYIFGFSFVYLVTVLVAAFCINFTFKQFSMVNLLNESFLKAKDIFYVVFKQMFVP